MVKRRYRDDSRIDKVNSVIDIGEGFAVSLTGYIVGVRLIAVDNADQFGVFHLRKHASVQFAHSARSNYCYAKAHLILISEVIILFVIRRVCRPER